VSPPPARRSTLLAVVVGLPALLLVFSLFTIASSGDLSTLSASEPGTGPGGEPGEGSLTAQPQTPSSPVGAEAAATASTAPGEPASSSITGPVDEEAGASTPGSTGRAPPTSTTGPGPDQPEPTGGSIADPTGTQPPTTGVSTTRAPAAAAGGDGSDEAGSGQPASTGTGQAGEGSVGPGGEPGTAGAADTGADAAGSGSGQAAAPAPGSDGDEALGGASGQAETGSDGMSLASRLAAVPHWAVAAAGGLVAILLLGGAVRSIVNRTGPESDPSTDTDLAGMGPVVDATQATKVGALDRLRRELEQEPHPRQAIRKAYAVVEGGFGNPELARRQSESPSHYLWRTLGTVDGCEHLLGELTTLFMLARYSRHPISEEMRLAAIDAVVGLRSRYRLAEAVPA
jgi:hypothetical protein